MSANTRHASSFYKSEFSSVPVNQLSTLSQQYYSESSGLGIAEMKLFAVTALLFALAAVVHGQTESSCLDCLTINGATCIPVCVPPGLACAACLLANAAVCIPVCLVGVSTSS